MLGRVAKRAVWVGRVSVFLVGLAVILAMVFGVASTALGRNGQALILGKAANTATKVTGLVGRVASGEALMVKNPSGGEALRLSVGDPTAAPATKTVAPMSVDSSAKVENLNADRLDGNSSEEFAASTHDHDGAYVNETDHTKTAHDALDIDADTVDGEDASEFARATADGTGKASDADKLDGMDSAVFAGTGRSSYDVGTFLTPCTPQVIRSQTISSPRPALVYAVGTAVYNPNGAGVESGWLWLELRDATNSTTLAGGGATVADGNGAEIPLTVQGVLVSGNNHNAVYNSSTPFEVTPGNTYVLRLVGNSGGSCTGNPMMHSIALTYVLIGK
jgi:hypothetical protein